MNNAVDVLVLGGGPGGYIISYQIEAPQGGSR